MKHSTIHITSQFGWQWSGWPLLSSTDQWSSNIVWWKSFIWNEYHLDTCIHWSVCLNYKCNPTDFKNQHQLSAVMLLWKIVFCVSKKGGTTWLVSGLGCHSRTVN